MTTPGDTALLMSLIEETNRADCPEALLQAFRDYTSGLGFDAVSYHIVARDLHRVPIDDGLVFQTFPQDWVDKYLEGGLHRIDPVIDGSRRLGKPFKWLDVGERMRLNDQQKWFLQELRAHRLAEGYAVPVFNAIGDMAYFGIGRTGSRDDRLPPIGSDILLACHQVHNRFVDLFEGERTLDVKLSNRERDVLSHVALGRSNTEIAERMGVSQSTVEEFLRRAFVKLGTTNRVTAALRAIGAGLVLP